MEKNIVRRIRETLGLSQERFAQELGMSTPSVRAFEAGHKVSEGAIEKLKSLAVKHSLADYAIELDDRKYTVREVFEQVPGRMNRRVRVPRAVPGVDLGDVLRDALEDVLNSGNPDAIGAVEGVLLFARDAIKSQR